MTNPYEAKARERKARQIAAAILAGYGLLDEWDRDVPVADMAEGITDPAQRAKVALVAGQRAPSDETWARVVALLRAAEAHDAAGPPLDPFEGLVGN